jgi:hypothetical protein
MNRKGLPVNELGQNINTKPINVGDAGYLILTPEPLRVVNLISGACAPYYGPISE